MKKPAARPRIVSVGGGKGGVGKSLVAANVAVALAQQGAQVVLVDADLGAANQHTLLGLEGRGPTLESLLRHEIESLEAARRRTVVEGLTVIAGDTAAPGSANILHSQKLRLLGHLGRLEADVVVLDIGAGVAFNAIDFFNAADVKVLVTSPQLTSIENAYAFLKGALFRKLQARATTPERQALLAQERPEGSTVRLRRVLGRLQAADLGFADSLRRVLDDFHVHLVGNQVMAPSEELVFGAVSRMIGDFLGISASVAGAIPTCRALHESVSRRRPYLLDVRDERAGHALRGLAQLLHHGSSLKSRLRLVPDAQRVAG